MLCTSISMPRLFMQPSFRPYPSISSPIISLPLRRNNTFPIRVPTSSESQTKTEIKSKANPKQSQFKIFSSQSQISSSATTTTATTAVEESPAAPKDSSGSDVIGKFYGGINAHDLGSVEDLIAENCIYEDLIFPQPFVGRKAILEFFNKFINSISTDLQFVIDDISNEDSSAVGVSWHLEWKGRSFPFSKGCSFYRLDIVNGKRQIIYGRDSVEPAIKPGEAALVSIRGVTWLLERFPRLVDLL
ncbi:uncharacterized protein LOC122091973 isoform X2 [Macadamia integrifolia]|uniref:uncharacterized protein LOC122091973 isoform X2 n=1 Tax=Macadamia integrifolia TaxID=60698 RepID=UPI001C4E71AC|nr:uncharacterized protein LOC122091973 isoform X2 [Macadamia integrifolia]